MKKSGGNNEIGFELTNGVFKKFCEEALKNQDKENPKIPQYVFIIDEINRGELSKFLESCSTLLTLVIEGQMELF